MAGSTGRRLLFLWFEKTTTTTTTTTTSTTTTTTIRPTTIDETTPAAVDEHTGVTDTLVKGISATFVLVVLIIIILLFILHHRRRKWRKQPKNTRIVNWQLRDSKTELNKLYLNDKNGGTGASRSKVKFNAEHNTGGHKSGQLLNQNSIESNQYDAIEIRNKTMCNDGVYYNVPHEISAPKTIQEESDLKERLNVISDSSLYADVEIVGYTPTHQDDIYEEPYYTVPARGDEVDDVNGYYDDSYDIPSDIMTSQMSPSNDDADSIMYLAMTTR